MMMKNHEKIWNIKKKELEIKTEKINYIISMGKHRNDNKKQNLDFSKKNLWKIVFT